MPSHTAYLSLGSNLGDRAKNIDRALAMFAAAGVRMIRRSSLYKTEPVDFTAQGWFLNLAAEAETALMPLQLLHAIRRVEQEMGRRRIVRAGPRVLDIDILLYGTSIVRTAELEIPHPRMAERRFVLVPMAELAPGLRHPVLKLTMLELLASTQDRNQVIRWQE
ncbi:MAG: 2-amino-4-hydroxy-6-hydroxymethyldihydropteridine diphosphokinase [Candidatus Acidiferrales bacterium]